MQYTEFQLPANNPLAKYCKAYVTDTDCRIMVGREPIGPKGEMEWHLSISCADRYPTWDEIKWARYEFIPDSITVGMILPPKEEYINIHPNCFHLNELH